MKKLVYILAAAAVVASCAKTEVNSGTPEGTGINAVSSLTVTSSPVVKTSTDGTLQVLWSPGDQIAVFGNKREANELATPFTITGSAGTNTATFTGAAVDCADYGIAVYPYVRENQASDDKYRRLLTDGTARTWVLREQHHVPNSIPNESMVMASRFDPKEGTMTFTPLSSVLEVKLYGGVSVAKIRVEEFATADAATLGGKNLSGRVDIPLDADGNLVVDENGVPTATAEESSYVEYICDTPVALGATAADATSFFIVVAGNAEFHHLNLIITDSEGKERIVKVGGKGETTKLTPGKVYTLPAREVLPIEATILAKWILDSSYDMGDFYVQAQSETAGSGKAVPTTGKGYIQFNNNDYLTGDLKSFRTNITNTPSAPSMHLCFIPVTESDEIIIAATDCSLSSGDQVEFMGCLWAYASSKNVSKYSTCATYELDYSLNGTNWTKIKDITLTANTSANPIGNTTAAADIDEIVTLTSSGSQILFRFLATSNTGTVSSVAISTNGQTRLCHGSKGQLAILQL